MKRLIATLVVGGMLVFGLAPAGAEEGGNMSNRACTAGLDVFFESHGDCVETGRTTRVDACVENFVPYKNIGQCIAHFRALGL